MIYIAVTMIISLFIHEREEVLQTMYDIDIEGDALVNDISDRIETIRELKGVYDKYNHSFVHMKKRLSNDPQWSQAVRGV